MKLILFTLMWSFIVFPVLLGASRGTAADCDDPAVLRVALNFGYQLPRRIDQQMAMKRFLTQLIGKDIELLETSGYSRMMVGLQNNKIDLTWVGANTFIQAEKLDYAIEPFATYYQTSGHSHIPGIGYQSLLIVRRGSEFDTIDSLRQATLALVDPGSTSGFLVPNVLFTEIITTPLEGYFKKVLMSGRHNRSIEAVANGTVDAAFVASEWLSREYSKGEYMPDHFSILWRSPIIPSGPFVYRSRLCHELKQKISEALLQAHLHPLGQIWLKEVEADKIVPIVSERFDLVRRLDRNRHRPEHESK